MNSIKETLAKIVFLLVACVSILAVALICIFLFANGKPAMAEIGLGHHLAAQQRPIRHLPHDIGQRVRNCGRRIAGGTRWDYDGHVYGVLCQQAYP